MQYLLKIAMFMFSISMANATFVDDQVAQKLQVIEKFKHSNVSDEYKVGMDKLEMIVKEILPYVLPDLPVDDPNYDAEFQKKVRTVKIPTLKRYMDNDLVNFRLDVSKNHRDTPESVEDRVGAIKPIDHLYYSNKPSEKIKQTLTDPAVTKEILGRLKAIHDEYNQNAYTCLEYLEFIFKLVYASENLSFENHPGQDEGLYTKFMKFKTTPFNNRAFVFPLHTRNLNFDGIFGEATMVAGAIINVWPVMYVNKPDALADNVILGPVRTTDHDIFGHAENMKDNPIWRDEVLKLVLDESPLIDKDLVDYIFLIAHEQGLNSVGIMVFDNKNFIPIYIDMINYVIRGLRQYIPQFKDLIEINEQKLFEIAQQYDSFQKNEFTQQLLNQMIYDQDQYKAQTLKTIENIKNRKLTDINMYTVLYYCIYGTADHYKINTIISKLSKQDQQFLTNLSGLNSIPIALKLSGKSEELP